MKTDLPDGTVFKARYKGEWEYGQVKTIPGNKQAFECLPSHDPRCQTAVHAFWKGNETLVPAKTKKTVAPITFRQAFPNPRENGAAEYRTIHDTIIDWVFDGHVTGNKVLTDEDKTSIIAMLEEFKGWATSSIAKLKGAVEPS